MRVLTCNVNGIRSASSKGFLDWLRRQKADVVCLQEVRAHLDQMPARARAPRGYHASYFLPERKGYSGVALWSRSKPDAVVHGMGIERWDDEGRLLAKDFGALRIVSLYMPSGSSGDERQGAKYAFMEDLHRWLKRTLDSGKSLIIAGDWNIAHREIDLKNWRSNRKNSGFLPEERAWLDTVLHDLGLVDVFRRLVPDPDEYTWWSNRGRAWEKNVGWRLDYQLVTPDLADAATDTSVYRRKRFSDHAPVTVDYGIDWPTGR